MSVRLDSYDLDMVKEYLANNPSPSVESIESWIPISFKLEDWMDFVNEDWEHKLDIFKQAGNCNIAGLPALSLKEITTDKIGKAVRISGKVVGISEPDAIPETVEYQCRVCQSIVNSPKGKCCSEKDLQPYIDPAHLIDRQIIKLQEGGHSTNPSRIAVSVYGRDMLWKVKYGKVANAIGLPKFTPTVERGPLRLTKHFDAYHIEQEEKECEVKLTPEFEQWMLTEIEKPEYWDKLVGSFAPHIQGFREIKEALILLILSASEDIPLNIWLAGDASVAKSLFLLYVCKMHQNAHYMSAAGATWPGLGAHAQQDGETKAWIVYPGAIALADRGIFAFDEVHAIYPTVAASLNEAGEQKTVSYAKGGQSGTLPARCAWLFASNSFFGDWQEKADIQENLKFLGPAREALISRFPLIFIMRDVINEEHDRKIALQILQNRSEQSVEKYRNDWKDEQGNEFYGADTLAKIFAWYATRKQPKVKPEDYDKLADWYVSQRQKDKDYYHKKSKPRNFDKGVFIAELKAKALGKSEVDQTDIEYAMDLFTKSRDAAAFDPKTQSIDTGMLEGNKAKSRIIEEQNKETQFRDAWEEVKAVKGEVTSADWVHQLVEGKRWKQHEAEQWIMKYSRGGLIIERASGTWEFIKTL